MKKVLNKRQRLAKPSQKLSHIVIAVVTCLILVAIVGWQSGLLKTEFLEGDIVLKTIYAPYDFTARGEINYKATESAKKEAMDAVMPVYILDNSVKESIVNKAKAFFNSIVLVSQDAGIEDKVSKIKEAAAPLNIPSAIGSSILELKDQQAFFSDTIKAIEEIMAIGVIQVSESPKPDADKILLIDRNKNTEQVKSINELWVFSEIKKNKEQLLSHLKDRKERQLLADFISAVLSPNIKYEQAETEIRKQAASDKVQLVYNILEVKKNELIINKGERISKEHIAKLQAIEQREPYQARLVSFFGITILVFLFLVLLVLYIEFYEPELIVGNKELILLSTICILLIFTAKVIVISPWPSNLIPVAAASMLVALLLNNRLAIITTCFASIIIGMMTGNRLDITAMSVVGGIVAIFAVRNVRRRSQLIAAGFSIGLANMTYFIGIGLGNDLDFHTYMIEALIGLGNGIISAIIVTGVLPIFESAFKIITDISLLEFSDLNHPILKEMVIKAPGTYHHSLVVGNLAEAACEAIGANSLLARVSAYFHDIGKIEKAEYFSENQSSADSLHDKLTPTMSSLIITNHVKNGVEFAQRYGLNEKIIDVIKQHHGTGLVFYFFKRALENTREEDVVEQGFRYPGPKPQTKEAACVLLADSVEAASRTLDDPTPASIKGLVRKIINNKFIDGQLDECDLTLKDLEKIAEIFTHILTGIYHSRVEYPEDTGKKK
jgi:putative nucleotidyltransferase with HDIG domain